MKLSLIIPVRNDAAALLECLQRLETAREGLEIIVVDASEPPLDSASIPRPMTLLHSPPGRGQQLHLGALHAHGEVLVFSHADTFLLPDHLEAIVRDFSENPAHHAGVFYRDFSWQYPRLAWLEPLGRRWQEMLAPLYGDQTQFFRREYYFTELGGYRPLPLLEDVEAGQRMRTLGGLVWLDPPLRTSLRRFQKKGWWRTKLRNMAYLWAYQCGVSPQRIYRWYYGE